MSATRFTVLGLVGILVLSSVCVLAQNIVSGELVGTVTDPQGAVVPNSTVTLVSKDFGTTQTTTTNAQGMYRFPLLRPGNYKVTATPAGFAPVTREVVVAVGQVTNAGIQVAVQGAKEVVQVTEEAPLLQTENANVTSNYDRKQIEMLPSPGQDLTNYALTAPGIVLSTGAGYGNFTAFGLPGTSNLFTVNGNDTNDPFNGLNNSGATNNFLGTNEIQELAIVTNGYTGQYGRAAGANVNYTTKSGTNSFHGNGVWYWNGRVMNANDYFNNGAGGAAAGADRPFANSNQWQGSIGGPIKKDKLFFFYNNEGLRYVLPTASDVYIPSPQFQADALNIGAGTVSAQNLAFYQRMFNIYNTAPNAANAVPVSAGLDPYDPGVGGLGCGDFAGTAYSGGGTFGLDVPCSLTFRSQASNKNTERLMSVNVDWVATQNDKFKFRWWDDRGLQATGTDPLSPIFNASSNQPQDTGQLNYTKVFGPNLINQLIVGGSYYSAIFNTADRPGALAAFPTQINFGDGLFDIMGNNTYNFPQGRNVSQAQVVDDLSWTHGRHNLKFGVNWRKNWITDFTCCDRFQTGRATFNSATDFFNGVIDGLNGDTLEQRFSQYIAGGDKYYSLGMYVQDEWAVTPKFKVTLSLRADRNSNEVCTNGGVGCVNRPITDWATMNHNVNTPYNQDVATGLENSFIAMEPVVFSPRVGFAYSAFGGKTVFRGGFGVFTDLYPGQLAQRFVGNSPAIQNLVLSPTTALAVATDDPNGVYAAAAATANAFTNGYNNGSTLAQIEAAMPEGVAFTRPTLSVAPTKSYNPKYLQWNFEIEQQMGQKMALVINYVGNHGYDEFVIDPTLNLWSPKLCAGVPCPTLGMPSAPPDDRFSTVNILTNDGYSNYNGLVISLSRRFTKGFSGNLAYTWSHSLDTVSNGGLQTYSFNTGSDSLTVQIDPHNLRTNNYASSDYDFRHNLSANYIWELPFKASGAMGWITNGWSVAGNIYARSGQPTSVVWSASRLARTLTYNGADHTGSLLPGQTVNNSGTRFLADFLGGSIPSCNSPGFDPINNPYQCLTTSMFGSYLSNTDFGNLARNYFRGPKYFNSDFSIYKSFKITESGLKFQVGLNMFNVFNHPNFVNPEGTLNAANFGQISATAVPASSPYGNFQGAAVSGRLMQTQLKISF